MNPSRATAAPRAIDPTTIAALAPRPIVEVKSVSKTYPGGVEALNGISLDFPEGKLTTLLGPSGCGKTTLLKIIAGLIPHSGGQVLVDGQEVTGPEPERAFVFQDFALMPWASVMRNVAFGLELRGVARSEREAIAERHITRVGLKGFEQKFPHELSGGMRQRVVIAIALALKPRLLVMDEPTTALDVIVQREILDRVAELRRELGLSILFISHDLPLLLAFSDRVGVMQQGRLVEIGETQTLRANAKDPYTQRLLAAFPSLDPPARPSFVPGAEGPMLLEVRGLGRTFERHALFSRKQPPATLAGISFDLRAGEVLALVGESGSGKSTLARLLARLDRPDEGSIRLAGQDALAGPMREHRARVQMVFQDPFASLNPARRVRHHLARPLFLHGEKAQRSDLDARVASLLSSVGLEPAAVIARRFPHELSGGQRQRVALARALAAAPRLLIADEPTSMLDASLRADLLALLRKLARDRGLGVLFITHDLASAAAIADRVIVLYRGKIVEEGPVGQVLREPTHDYTRQLLAAARFEPETTDATAAVRPLAAALETHEALS